MQSIPQEPPGPITHRILNNKIESVYEAILHLIKDENLRTKIRAYADKLTSNEVGADFYESLVLLLEEHGIHFREVQKSDEPYILYKVLKRIESEIIMNETSEG